MARCSLFALVLVWVLTSSTAQAKIFNPTTFHLANGLEVVVIPNHRVPVVTHMLWYKVGAADEPRGKSGIAHFLEHLMFKGTPRPMVTQLFGAQPPVRPDRGCLRP